MREKERKKQPPLTPRQPLKPKKDKTIQSHRVSRSELPGAVRKLRLQNAKLERLLKVSPAAFLIVNSATGKILDINKTAEDLLEISRRSALKDIAHVRIFFVRENDFDSLSEQLIKEKNILQHVAELKTALGNLHTVNLCATAVTIGDENCFIFNFSDCATDASSERLLQNYYGKITNLEKALDASNLVSVTDAQGIIIYANAKFCEVSKYSRNELLGQNHRIINSGYHPKEFIRSLWKTITAGETWSGEIKNRAKDGSLYWVNSTIVPFTDKTGKPYQYFAIRQDITERKRVALDLERNREVLLQAQKLAKLGSWEWYPELDKPVWSPEMYRIYGMDENLPAVPFAEVSRLFAPESWKQLEVCVGRTYATGEPYQLECEIVRSDGTHGWIISRGTPIRSESGLIVGLRGTVQDITEQKLADERNRLIVNALPDLIFVLDRNGVFLDYHASEPKRLAYRPEFFLGKSFRDIFDEALAEKMIEAIGLVVGGSSLERIEYTLPFEGQTGHYEATFTPLDRERIMIVVRDTTERRQNELKLRDQATLLDNARDAILVRNLDHTIEYWNKGAEQMYGWSQQEVLGKSVRELLYTAPETFDAATKEVLSSGEFSGELEQSTRDGRSIIVQARWTLLKDDAGKAKSVFAINTDITERKNLEQQFLRAQRLESIGTLAGGIAHDLNNVLTPIMLATAVLKTGDLKNDQLDLLAMIEASVKHGTRMVRQVLSFARGAEGNPRPMRLQTLLVDLEPIIRDTFPRNIDIKIETSENLWLVKADFTQLHQVLMNLAVNARDAMPGGGRLTIETANVRVDESYVQSQAEVVPGQYVVLSVSDTGVGMDAATMAQAFEPFFTTKPVGKGTGLGLSQVYGFVKQSGGNVKIYSEPGSGTTVRVYLPRRVNPGEEGLSPAEDLSPEGTCDETVLVLEDDEEVRAHSVDTLRELGYRVLEACNGAAALHLLEQQPRVDLLFTDVVLPGGMTGAEVAVQARAMRPQLRVLFTTGYARDAIVHHGRLDSGVQLITKPFTYSDLAQKVRDVLEAAP